MDIVSEAIRSRMMAGIKGKNTKPELMIRSALHRAGFRFRLHKKDLPGRPDLAFPRHRAVIFVNGCFWHGHGCHLFRWPSTRREFWEAKIGTTIHRDHNQTAALHEAGWRVGVIWECAIKGRTRLPMTTITERCILWLDSNQTTMEIRGE